ncbi:hypothetical protein, partial [Hungatella hominis]
AIKQWLVLLEFSGFYILFNLLFSKCVCCRSVSAATFISYHSDLFLSTTFFIFFKTFSAVQLEDFWKSLPPFSAARYIISKQPTKVNMFFEFF